MNGVDIQGRLRSDFGKKASRRLRSEHRVPGVLYGKSRDEVLHFSVSAAQMRPLIYTPDFQLVGLQLGGKTYRCVLKDLQFDKLSDELIHFDLLELFEGQKVTVSIPLQFRGTPAGVLVGGKMVTKVKALKVRTFPQYLQQSIVVDVSHLQLNESVRVEDVQVAHYEIMNSPRIPIVSIALTRQLKQQDSEAKKEEKRAAA